MGRWIDQWPCLFLDLNGTFMFGCDRFDDPAALFECYQALGGRGLSSDELYEAARNVCSGMWNWYEDPRYVEGFPSLREGIRRYAMIPAEQEEVFEEAFARQEVGFVPKEYAEAVSDLSRSHRLALVSNVWSRAAVWREALEEAGVLGVFETCVFSSDCGCIKPSPRMFQEALNRLGVSPEEVLFIGDSLRCDMAGAKGCGLRTLWVTDSLEHHDCVDGRVKNLIEALLPQR